jgi:hypothetical protein
MFDAFGHAMLYACRFKTVPRSAYAKAAIFRWKGDKGEIRFAVGQHLHDFGYLHPDDPFWSMVLLSTCHLTCKATRAVLVIDQ